MAKRLTIKDIYDIKLDVEAGLTIAEIARVRGISRQAVYNAINNKTGDQARQVADRYEYFNKTASMYTGNSVNGQPELALDGVDPVLDEIIFYEELQQHE